MEHLYKFVIENLNSGKMDKQMASQLIQMLKQQENNDNGDIAIIGLSVKFPLAQSAEEYWRNITDGVDCTRSFPKERRQALESYLLNKGLSCDKDLFLEGAFLEEVDNFDYEFFGVSPKEASLMAPSQRLFLETAWKALEDAGYAGEKIIGSNTGVYVGYANQSDRYVDLVQDVNEYHATSVMGNLSAVLPSRISYHLDLQGPSMNIDTACSSSLVSVGLACQAIRDGKCDMAIAGGVKLYTTPYKDSVKLGFESSDGRTRAFDNYSDGSGIGEGVGVVIVKPLKQAIQDGDNIHAVIKGVAMNQDGQSLGISAPNPAQQTKLFIKAWEDANIHPETISYIETHGTGTHIGDPIEISGINNAFKQFTNKEQFCAISSAKTTIGHLYEGAGIANLIKGIMALKNKKIPPTHNFNQPNEIIDFTQSSVYVNTKVRDWDTVNHPRRCGISSFGISGTNCHLVLEEAPPKKNSEFSGDSKWNLFTLSAKSLKGLNELVSAYQEQLAGKESIFDIKNICYTVNTGRGHYNHRLILMVRDMTDLQKKLKKIVDSQTFIDREVFYDYHKVLSSADCEKNGLTEKDQTNLSAQANEISGHLEYYEHNDNLWELICRLYTQGAELDWKEFYKKGQYQVLSLPTYPFERNSCWVSSPRHNQFNQPNQYYTIKWKEKNIDSLTSKRKELGSVVIFTNGNKRASQLIQWLQKEKRLVIVVNQGEHYEKGFQNQYTVGSSESDYHQLFSDIKQQSLSQIIHFSPSYENSNLGSLEQLNQSQENGLYSLYKITRSIIQENIRRNLDLVLITECVNEVTGQEPFLQPQYASMLGIGKTISQEYPTIHCRVLDIDNKTDFNYILKELNYLNENFVVSYRENQRYVEELIEDSITNSTIKSIELKNNGVYIITGGLGGVGLEICKYLTGKAKVNLALISRSNFPSRELWDEVIAKGEDAKLLHQIEMIKEMEQNGSTISFYSANVAEYQDMSLVVDILRNEFGQIKGVVHLAGVVGNGYIVRRSIKEFEQVIQPKIQGTWILDQLTSSDNLDFFVLFSSGIALLGEAGHADYVAANAFLDAYASYRNKKGKRTLTIDWVAWKAAGTAVTYGFNKDMLFKATPTEQATNAFGEVINKKIGRILIGELNPDGGEYTLMLEDLRVDLSPRIGNILQKSKEKLKVQDNLVKSGVNTVFQEKSLSKEVNQVVHDDVEEEIINIYRNILGYEKIDVDTSFFELGGDSLMLNRMHEDLERKYPGVVETVDLFVYTSVSKLVQFIQGSSTMSKSKTKSIGKTNSYHSDDIAIIGMSAKMPMADDVKKYWNNIRNGVECITAFPKQRKQDMNNYIHYTEGIPVDQIKYHDGSFIEDVDMFDYEFFNLTPNEAKLTDPHQRLFMQNVWHAIEDAGYAGGKLVGTNTGVFMGYANHLKDSYLKMNLDVDPELLPLSVVGNVSSMMPSRISYLLDLKGPTMVVDTACSSTLVSVHQACKSIQSGDCETAIVSGVRVNMMPLDREFMKIGIESSTDRTKTFDYLADGSGIGEGAATVILKPLSQAVADGDNIHAVIKGSAINQDGSSMSITAPNPEAQADVLEKAWNNSGINPETLSFIEAHGTATSLGDPIEIKGLTQAFERFTDSKQICAIGSVKTNIGHLFEGAGIAGLVKSVLSLKNSEIPPSINFNQPNSKIVFEESPVYVNSKLRKWEGTDTPMRAGVSSFGFSGTNCHIVLEQAPAINARNLGNQNYHILTLSARNYTSLNELLDKYINFAKTEETICLEDLCFTANTGRNHFKYRMALILQNEDNLADKLQKLKNDISEKDNIKTSIENKQIQEKEDLLSLFIETGSNDRELLEEICQLYVSGVDFKWDLLYKNLNVRRVSIPNYPFLKKRCWIEISDGVTKYNFSSKVKTEEKEDKFFTVKWKESTLGAEKEAISEKTVMIFKDKKWISDKIIDLYKKKDIRVIEVSFGENFAKHSNGYTITGSQEEYSELINQYKHEVGKVIHLSTITSKKEISNLNELENSQSEGVYSLFYLVQAISKCKLKQEIDVVLVSDYTCEVNSQEEIIKPENATLLALGKVVRLEMPNISCRAIDIDEVININTLFKEINSKTDVYHSAYRKNTRYTEQFTEVDLEKERNRDILINENGTYVITGGLGGIGLEVAKHLSTKNSINLVLISRTNLPDRMKWEEILKEDNDKKLCDILHKLKTIEDSGTKVTCYSADVTNLNEMQKVINNVRKKFNGINGIIHGAGLAGMQVMANQKKEDFDSVFKPKVQGTWILDYLTREDNLEFFVSFSSIATLFSAPSQGDYVAANSYLDSYSDYLNKLGRSAQTINWSTWKEAGMAFRHNFTEDTLFKAIGIQKAISGLDSVMQKDLSKVLIGEINYKGPMISLLNKSLFDLSPEIKRKLDILTTTSKLADRQDNKVSNGQVILLGRNGGEYKELETKLASICQKILGFDEINIDDNFFELGADSIILTQMQALIDKEYPDVVKITDMFSYPSIGKLSQFINKTNEEDLIIVHESSEDIEDKLRDLFDSIESNDIDAQGALKQFKEL